MVMDPLSIFIGFLFGMFFGAWLVTSATDAGMQAARREDAELQEAINRAWKRAKRSSRDDTSN